MNTQSWNHDLFPRFFLQDDDNSLYKLSYAYKGFYFRPYYGNYHLSINMTRHSDLVPKNIFMNFHSDEKTTTFNLKLDSVLNNGNDNNNDDDNKNDNNNNDYIYTMDISPQHYETIFNEYAEIVFEYDQDHLNWYINDSYQHEYIQIMYDILSFISITERVVPMINSNPSLSRTNPCLYCESPFTIYENHLYQGQLNIMCHANTYRIPSKSSIKIVLNPFKNIHWIYSIMIDVHQQITHQYIDNVSDFSLGNSKETISVNEINELNPIYCDSKIIIIFNTTDFEKLIKLNDNDNDCYLKITIMFNNTLRDISK